MKDNGKGNKGKGKRPFEGQPKLERKSLNGPYEWGELGKTVPMSYCWLTK